MSSDKIFNLENLSNVKDKCYISIKGNVYDVTSYLDSHPGGRDILLDYSGKDCTEEFEDIGHSKSAIVLLNDHLVGKITDEDKKKILEKSQKNSDNCVIC